MVGESKQQEKFNLLLVDDEQAVLNALYRALKKPQFNLFTALTAMDGLEIIAEEQVHLVISDMQMPVMNGAEFLSIVAEKSPGTIRMILTGHADLGTTIQAINEGKIFSFVTKPWRVDNLLETIDAALYTQQLELEKARLLKLTHKQNEELVQLNANLETRVEKRTQQLVEANDQLDGAYKDLKRNYETAIEVFCRMMELRNKDQAGHCKRVAKLARGIAIEMGLSTPEIDKLYYSGLLHDVGKIHLSTKLLGTAYSNLSAEDKAEYQQHSVLGEILLTPLDQFHHISHFIRHHHEHYNGRGFPDRLKGDRIPLGAAILSVADDFDEACSGFTFDKLVPLEESRQIIADGSGESYHPEVVSAFLLAQEKLSQQDLCVDKISSENVTQGMRLTKDLIRPDGVLLLTSNTELTDQHIQKIQQLEGVQKMKFELWVSRVK